MTMSLILKMLAEDNYLDLVNSIDSISEDDKKEIIKEYVVYRMKFQQGMDDITDDDDLGYFIAIKYTEIKASWIQLNLRLNYQAVMKGSADQKLLVKASLLSNFLAVIEPRLKSEHLEMIQDLLSTRLAA